ncbi:LOW QUALITY PROTEIN: olfactory receptor 5AR1-like [Aptenodytes patagonicus]|uniref:LOW QUALITY PROTEIN: olfactory receptor 5AR1-like n=1 Tax=Aptenodytes patagonicus TaxID=9234 RepID=UPI003FA1857C
MVRRNKTTVDEFILLGITDIWELQVFLFVLFLLICVTSLVGNLGMIALIRLDSRLHTPMYFFLCHLSLVDLSNSSAVAPKMLVSFSEDRKAISLPGCAAQMYFCGVCIIIGCYLLAAMAYNRYMAICYPLCVATMSQKACVQLAVGSYTIATVNEMVLVSSVFSLHFCGPNVINHFFCDIPPLLKLSCSSTTVNEHVLFTIALSTLVFIVVSYGYILTTVPRTHSSEGGHKAFSTCASHLTSVSIFYGTMIFMYLRPSSSYSLDQDKVASIVYTLVIPMLNPLIYSLRNMEVKDALKKLLEKVLVSFRSQTGKEVSN